MDFDSFKASAQSWRSLDLWEGCNSHESVGEGGTKKGYKWAPDESIMAEARTAVRSHAHLPIAAPIKTAKG